MQDNNLIINIIFLNAENMYEKSFYFYLDLYERFLITLTKYEKKLKRPHAPKSINCGLKGAKKKPNYYYCSVTLIKCLIFFKE